MVRPRRSCRVQFSPRSCYFKPTDGGKGKCGVVELTPEETETLRLRNITGLDQTQAAARMGISQSTYQRILTAANQKVTEALIRGKAIRILKKQHDKT